MEQFANRARTTLAAPLALVAQGTSEAIQVTSVEGLPPEPTYRLVAKGEIMLVTAEAGLKLTVTRGAEGTAPVAHKAGDVLTHVLTAGALEAYVAGVSGEGVEGERARAEGVEAGKASTAALAAEGTAREAGDSANATAITAETTRAKAAEKAAQQGAEAASDKAGAAAAAQAAAEGAGVPLAQKGAANGVASLDGAGLLPTSQLPPLALTDPYVVNSEAAQLALVAHKGDFAIRTDLSKTFVHNGGTAKTMADWTELVTPGDVTSVNGHTGTVALAAADVGADKEGAAAAAQAAAEGNSVPLSQKGKAGGVAELDSEGHLPAGELPPSVESTSALATEPTVYVAKTGNDSNSGLGWGQAFLTVQKAIEHLLALSGGTGRICVGRGTFIENPLTRPASASIIGTGWHLTTIKLKAGANGNVVQDAAWGSTTVVNEGGLIDHLTIDGNASEQTATIAPGTIVRTTTAISGAGATLPVVSTAGFPESGNLWVGRSRCAYTGKTAEGFTGVTCGTSFSATEEMRVVPFGGVGHGVAIQSTKTVLGGDLVVRNCVGSGTILQGTGGAAYVFECRISGKRNELNGRYDLEVLPYAFDGQVDQWIGFASGKGSIFVGEKDWTFGQIHPNGNLVNGTGQLARALIHVCAGNQRFLDSYFDHAPYECIRIDTMGYNQNVNDIAIAGETTGASCATAGAGVAIQYYGNGTSLAVRQKIDLDCADRVFMALSPIPTTQTVGVQNLKEPPGGKVQVLSALPFSPLGSAAGGTLTVSAGGTLAYTGVSSVGAYIAEEAAKEATTVKLNSTAGLAPSGIVTAYPNTGSVNAVQIKYTGISGNELTGVTGLSEAALPANTGVAQHFLTGVTGGTGETVASGTTLTQPGREVKLAGHAHFRLEKNLVSPITRGPKLRLSWVLGFQTEGTSNYNPFRGKVEIKVGSTEASIAHNLGATPNFVEATPSGDPQQRWWVTADATNITVHTAANIATTGVQFWVTGRASVI